jgi:predicted molibdopterin-dependent oxidoreductase YjgC
MKKKFFKALLPIKEYLPYLMLVLLLSSIMVTSFHNHDCSKNSDNCTACRLQQSFSSLTIESTTYDVILQKPLSDSITILNEQATDPSQKIVCSSHAPPQYS